MRILATSDLHYNIARSQGPTRELAKEVCRRGGDCLLFVGDSASTDLAMLEEVFGLFESFRGPRLAVAGNHELWTTGGVDSLARYERDLAEACRKSGVHYLDAEPYQDNGVAIVGNVGWYDFSFRRSGMEIPLRFYQHKVAPGAAAYYEKHRHLLEEDGDVSERARQVTTRWMDGERVRLPIGDVDFTRHLADRLRRDLEKVSATAERVVVAVHHLPFAELVPPTIVPNWAFAAGFLGSELLGETILEFPKVSHVLCGHSHRRRTCRKGGFVCTSIGSTYREKQYEVVDVT
ncbi:MAG TPA: metallophosphoesterase [Phycisphaerae bacterium]|nr:metallophosphoesterase [Phycisphaerae bacterium]